jgi:hypothetical protein
MDQRLRLDVYPSLELRRAIDKWRLQQDDPPSRAEAARQLIEIGLAADGGQVQPAKKSPR